MQLFTSHKSLIAYHYNQISSNKLFLFNNFNSFRENLHTPSFVPMLLLLQCINFHQLYFFQNLIIYCIVNIARYCAIVIYMYVSSAVDMFHPLTFNAVLYCIKKHYK